MVWFLGLLPEDWLVQALRIKLWPNTGTRYESEMHRVTGRQRLVILPMAPEDGYL